MNMAQSEGRARKFLAGAWVRWGSPALIVLSVWMMLAAFPAGPAPDGTELDQSWALALNLAHSQGLVAGKDVVWTYGPLGYLSQPSPASGQKYVPLFYRLGIYGLWGAVLIRLRRRPWMVLALGLAALLDPFVVTDHLEMAIYAVTLLALVDDSPRWRDAGLSLLALLAGIALLGKVSLGLQAAVMLACVAILLFWRNRSWTRQILAPAAILLVTVTALFWASTGDLGSLPLYFRNSLQITSGYSENMSILGPAWQVLLVLAAMAFLLGVIPVLADDRSRLLPILPLTAVCALAIFKNSMVRQEGAHFVSFAPKLLLASLFLLAAAQAMRSRRILVGFQVACMLFGYWFAARNWAETPAQIKERLLLNQSFAWMMVFLKWPQSWNNLEVEGKGNLSEMDAGPIYRAEVGTHSADSVPWDVAQIRANGWEWRPRPVFQSYAAYTPELDAIDAAQLAGKRAADFLLVSWKAIDGRHPFLEEPLTWQERLNHYQTDLHDRSLLLLKRREGARFSEVKLTSSTNQAGWDQDIAVPDSPGVVVRLSIEKSWWGSLRASLYRLNPVWMEVTRQSGHREKWRVVRANLRDGVRIRELPSGLEDLALLSQPGCGIADPVSSFRMHTDSPSHYEAGIGLQWSLVTEEPAPCKQLLETQASFDVTGGKGVVKMHGDHDQKLESQSEVTWAQVEPEKDGVAVTVAPNLAGASRLGSIAVGGLKFRMFQSGLSSWTAVFRQSGSLGLFLLGEGVSGTAARTFGAEGDQPVAGDWTGSGVTRIGVYRRGAWFLDLNNNGKWDGVEGGDGYYEFGLPGDRPVVGDWNGDGTTKLGVFRAGQWVLDFNGTHKYNSSSGGMRAFHFGLPTDLPVVSNWKHTDNRDQVGVFRNGMWYVDSSGDEKYDPKDDDLYPFGVAGDTPIIFDWGKENGGKKIGVYRHGMWVLDKNGDNRYDSGDIVFSWGKEADVPLTGHWKK